jgi:hypothetical protein
VFLPARSDINCKVLSCRDVNIMPPREMQNASHAYSWLNYRATVALYHNTCALKLHLDDKEVSVKCFKILLGCGNQVNVENARTNSHWMKVYMNKNLSFLS